MMQRVDTEKIPAVDVQLLGMTFLSAVKEFFSDPLNEEKFLEWKRQQAAHT